MNLLSRTDAPRCLNTRRAALALLSAALQTLALPPWSFTSLAWVALAPLFLALRRCAPGAGAVFGLLWGVAAIWGTGYWVPVALASYYQQPPWFGVLFAFAVSVAFGSAYAAFGACACARPFQRGAPLGALLLAALWVAWEFARAHLLTGNPWLLFGYALVPTPVLAQAADFGGVYVLSFALVAVNAAVAEFLVGWIEKVDRQTVAASATIIVLVPLLLWAYGAARLSVALPAGPRVPVRIVQGDVDIGTQWREDLYGEGLSEYLRLSATDWAAPAGTSRMLIWPESALTFFLADEPAYRTAIAGVLRRMDADLIVGAPYVESGGPTVRYFNSAFYVTANGTLGARYDKRHLLPFAEYFPLRTIDLLRRRFERVRFFTPGAGPAVQATRIGTVATVICFEGIFPALVRDAMAQGAVALVNLSNDAWLGRGAGPEQHLSMVALRAIENRTWVVRATTTGISAIIDPFGYIVGRSPSFTPVVLDGEIVPMQIATPYKRLGDVFAYACVLISTALVIRRWTRGARRNGTSSRHTGLTRTTCHPSRATR